MPSMIDHLLLCPHGKAYYQRLLALNPYGFWPANDLSGTTALDLSGNGYHGTYSNVTLASVPDPDGRLVAAFNGSNSRLRINTMAPSFNGAEGSAVLAFKLTDGETWTNNVDYQYGLHISADGSNQLYIAKFGQPGRFRVNYNAGGTSKGIERLLFTNVEWTCAVLTWSAMADLLAFWLNSDQVGTESSLGTWAGAPTDASIGSAFNVASHAFPGSLICALYDYALEESHVRMLSRGFVNYPFVGDANFYFAGDSLTSGTGATVGLTDRYPAQLATSWRTNNPGQTLNWLEVSIGGAVVADILAATGVIDGLYRGAGDVACVWIGTNDLRTLPDTAATVYSRITSWIQGRQAAGFRVIVLTILPCTKAGTPAGYEAERLDLNTLINANAAGADGIADIAADALLDDADDPVYFFDKLHLTTAGYGVVAGIVEAAIDILA